jgi:hypothetical protein
MVSMGVWDGSLRLVHLSGVSTYAIYDPEKKANNDVTRFGENAANVPAATCSKAGVRPAGERASYA